MTLAGLWRLSLSPMAPVGMGWVVVTWLPNLLFLPWWIGGFSRQMRVGFDDDNNDNHGRADGHRQPRLSKRTNDARPLT